VNDLAKNLIVWVILAAVLMSVFNSFAPEPEQNTIDYSTFLNEVQNDRVSEVTIADLIIHGERNDGSKFKSVRPNVQDPKLIDDLMNHNVKIIGKEREEPSLFSQLLVAAFPILLILAIFVFFMRQMQGGGGGKGGPMSFGKSKAKLLTAGKVSTTFDDVAGCEEAKQDVQELVDFLRDPTKFQKLGGKIPRGVLMVGPPGTGKTLFCFSSNSSS
jgi:cell division protease FtsH